MSTYAPCVSVSPKS